MCSGTDALFAREAIKPETWKGTENSDQSFRARFWNFLSGPRYTRRTEIARSSDVKLRKRHKIVDIFWIPFCSLAVGICAFVGWAAKSIHL
jgi:hypothetical protein